MLVGVGTYKLTVLPMLFAFTTVLSTHISVRRTQKSPVEGRLNGTFNTMTGHLIGWARVSTNDHDLTAQKNTLAGKGRHRGKQPKLSRTKEAHQVTVHRAGRHTTVDLAELFAVEGSTVYRAIKRPSDAA